MATPMRIRPAYKKAWESQKLLEAIDKASGPHGQPCTSCKSFEFCRRNHQDCRAFRDWVACGRFRPMDRMSLFRSIYVSKEES